MTNNVGMLYNIAFPFQYFSIVQVKLCHSISLLPWSLFLCNNILERGTKSREMIMESAYSCRLWFCSVISHHKFIISQIEHVRYRHCTWSGVICA